MTPTPQDPTRYGNIEDYRFSRVIREIENFFSATYNIRLFADLVRTQWKRQHFDQDRAYQIR